jgi:hypothetical protein
VESTQEQKLRYLKETYPEIQNSFLLLFDGEVLTSPQGVFKGPGILRWSGKGVPSLEPFPEPTSEWLMEDEG